LTGNLLQMTVDSTTVSLATVVAALLARMAHSILGPSMQATMVQDMEQQQTMVLDQNLRTISLQGLPTWLL